MATQTNIEFVTELMTFSSRGALMQVFVIEAIADYARRTAASPTPIDTAMFSGEAWQACAREAMAGVEKHLASWGG